ncbi:glycosyltransferase family 4 protein [Romboutsia sp. 1001713B170207_170306_H8]|uniref:glycosyltransferase family 4 protein n=1 Tax=Romboutsia sp. 1001713B170207_170306_H8 TaxID=2787112 RepID=UPI00189BA0C3|nr:glycosyltransferase family 4 protein [Romboutsia sp. 1001713B170207_170306_H8]
MNKKVLILSNHFVTIHKFRQELVMNLVERGHDVVVSLPYSNETERIEDLGVRTINTYVDRKSINPIKDIKLFIEYINLIRLEKPDIVVSYTIKPNAYGGIASKLCKCEFIANVTGLGSAYYKGGFVKKIVSALYKMGFKSAKSVIFENEGNAQVLIDDKTIKQDQAVVMNGAGVNLDKFSFCPMPSGNVIRFLFVGRIMAEKGIEELFEVIKRIRSEYNNVEFSFIGWFEDDYSEIIKEFEEKNFIKYYGYQDDVIPFIRNSHCIVLPSYHEGMANVLLEGAAMGRALIASDIPGCREAIVEGKNGWTCKVKDVDDLYGKIKRFIDLSYNEKVKMGKFGRCHMEEIFDKKKVVKLTVEEIER